MRLVIIESPFSGDRQRNEAYLKACIRDCLERGESPIASHVMYTAVLDDNLPDERELGIKAGFAWWKAADRIVFYTDLGWSNGMRDAFDRAERRGDEWECRKLGGEW